MRGKAEETKIWPFSWVKCVCFNSCNWVPTLPGTSPGIVQVFLSQSLIPLVYRGRNLHVLLNVWIGGSYFPHKLCLLIGSFFFFLPPHLWHMEVLRLGIKLEPQLQAYTTATATLDPKPTEWGQGHNIRFLTPGTTMGTSPPRFHNSISQNYTLLLFSNMKYRC